MEVLFLGALRKSTPVDSQFGVASKHVEVGVAVKYWGSGPDCNRGYQAIDQLSHRFAATFALTVKGGGGFIVSRLSLDRSRPRQQSAQQQQVRLVARAGKYLHPDRIAHCDLLLQHFVNEPAYRRPGVAQEFDPRRSVDQDQGRRSDRIDSRSPSHPLPRRARASSIEADSAASVRRAKFIAARLVVNRKRRITSAHALSSISMLVRDIHKGYTQ